MKILRVGGLVLSVTVAVSFGCAMPDDEVDARDGAEIATTSQAMYTKTIHTVEPACRTGGACTNIERTCMAICEAEDWDGDIHCKWTALLPSLTCCRCDPGPAPPSPSPSPTSTNSTLRKCTRATDCAVGEVCLWSGYCAPKPCTTSSDCGQSQMCVDSKCYAY